MVLQVIEIINNCSRIAVVAIRKLIQADERTRQHNQAVSPVPMATSPPPGPAHDAIGASLQIFSAIIENIATHLGTLSSAGYFQTKILKRTTCGVLDVTKDVTAAVEAINEIKLSPHVSVVFNLCAKCFDLLCSIQIVHLEQLPEENESLLLRQREKWRRHSRGTGDAPSASTKELPCNQSGDTLAAWTRALTDALRSVDQAQEAGDEGNGEVSAGCEHGEAASPQVDVLETSLINKSTVDKRAHLLLFNSIASSFMSHSSNEIRGAAGRLLRACDMSDVLFLYLEMDRRVKQLEQQNSILTTDLKVARSTIPF